MVPPIKGSFEVEIKTDKQADSIVEDLNEQERKRLFDALNKKMGAKESKEETTEKKENNYEYLLNKPNMTAKDKAGMEKSIKFLVDGNMDTTANLKRLEAINYGSNYIEIGGVKRARENLKAEPNGKDIFKHGDEVYFKFNALKEQNKLLAQQGMEIPGKNDFAKALQALPGNFSQENWYAGANILGTILDLPMSGGCNSAGELFNEGRSGYVRSSSEENGNTAWSFGFNEDEGELLWLNRNYALAVRPVLK